MRWFKLVSLVKKVNMFKKKCSVCIFLIYNGSKPKHFLFNIFITLQLNCLNVISRFVPFFVSAFPLTLLRSELIISVLRDVAYPWESLVSTLFNNLQISYLQKHQKKKKNQCSSLDWNIIEHFMKFHYPAKNQLWIPAFKIISLQEEDD